MRSAARSASTQDVAAARSAGEIRAGNCTFDPVRRITRDRKETRISHTGGGEQPLVQAERPFSNANVYFRAPADQLAQLIGAKIRVYSITDEVKTLEAETTFTSAPAVNEGVLVAKIRARGGLDALAAVLVMDPAAALPTSTIVATICSFETGGDEETASPVPPGPIPPSPAPEVFPVVVRVNNVSYAVTSDTDPETDVFMRGLTAARTVALPATPTLGQKVVVKDEDGSLAAFDIVIDGNGNTIDGAATYTMTVVQNGAKGAVVLEYQGAGWSVV